MGKCGRNFCIFCLSSPDRCFCLVMLFAVSMSSCFERFGCLDPSENYTADAVPNLGSPGLWEPHERESKIAKFTSQIYFCVLELHMSHSAVRRLEQMKMFRTNRSNDVRRRHSTYFESGSPL